MAAGLAPAGRLSWCDSVTAEESIVGLCRRSRASMIKCGPSGRRLASEPHATQQLTSPPGLATSRAPSWKRLCKHAGGRKPVCPNALPQSMLAGMPPSSLEAGTALQQGPCCPLPSTFGAATRELKAQGKVGRVSFSGNFAVASFGPVACDSREPQAAPKRDLAKTLCAMMPYIVVVSAATALIHPPSFTWFTRQYYPLALGGIMLSIGVQLSVDDFVTVFKQPVSVFLGLAIQYVMKPVLGLLTVLLFQVPPEFAAGLILTACVPGAQLSSYAASLAKGSIALAVVLTSLATFASVFTTPALSKLFIGSVIPVDAIAMAKSIMQVVIAPISLGLLLNTYAKPAVDRARPYLPLMALFCTSLCIGSPLAFNRATLVSMQGVALVLPVLFFHVVSTTAGYWASQVPAFRQDEASAKTQALCAGMQSSTLAMLLASQFLGGSHPVPASCSVVLMSIVGLSLGSFWGKGETLRERVSEFLHDLVALAQPAHGPHSTQRMQAHF